MVFNPSQETLIDSFTNFDYDPFSQDSAKVDTPYYSVNIFFEVTINGFSVIHLNIRSLQKNFENFKFFLNSCKTKFDIICLSETWCEELVSNNSLYYLRNYTLFEQPRTSGKRGGGVLMYVSDVFSSVRTKFTLSNTNAETLFIELSFINCKNIIIGIVYRPPNGKYEVFKNHLKSIIKKIDQEKKFFVWLGISTLML